ncbi:MAG: hypothetical protein A2864_02155 [Candidatus Woykebacteria bacterium RIFCSPHIGHO2_01_FULL_39_12]|uniref:EfeO-type cupredoxin-like domain-containing protein n=2 Tax=Candidatus Woykeibacteriota TaxID=1817899 RepID=A0A1G1WD64_9BACT|nr:MAG: hypothetical protein A2134_02250 [Candidatus Woykebacteria bacterium RBG_16_39_9b]OGY28040.1 MAG: hypothetical protein A2864_02155 [Candidatus Woykebacteria bacterium RIFCSPHIGHO2_01_FULL_39_12]
MVVVVAAFILFKGVYQPDTGSTPATTTGSTSSAVRQGSPSANKEEGVTITYSNGSFSPSEVTVNSGSKITWLNNGDQEIKIGANPHPIHTGNKEVSGGDFTLNLAPGESKSVVVTKTGSFGYHNHLNSSEGGTITVK